MSRVSEDELVFGSVVLFAAWYLIGLPLLYIPEMVSSREQEMQSTNWAPILFSFLGGSAFTYLINKVAEWWFRPIIRVRFVQGGCYVNTARGNPPTHRARFLRLRVENTGRSVIKGCVGYIVCITKAVNNTSSPDEQEVLELNWSHVGKTPRDIPQGAFFYLDIASLDLIAPNNVLWLTVDSMPNHLAYLLSGAGTFDLNIKVAAENATPVNRKIHFGFDPRKDDLTFEYDS
jgi:hypothetical protein